VPDWVDQRLMKEIGALRRIIGQIGSENPFSNFGTLQGDTVDSSDANAHFCGDPLPAGRINNKSLWRPDSIS
jgi:hypothetical protein